MEESSSQIYGSCRSTATSILSSDITQCVDAISSWMRSNCLQLNAEKTEVMWCSSTRRLSQLPHTPIVVADEDVHPVSSVRDLGIFINDNDLGAATRVRRTVSRCFVALRQRRHLRRYVTDDCFRSLVVSLIHPRLDYGNFDLVGLPAYLVRQLQSVNAAARLVFRLRRYNHITDALANLHWLRLPQRVDYKVAVMAFRVLHGLAPPYLDQLARVADLPGRQRLRLSTSYQLHVPAHRLVSTGRRSFPVAAAILWNSLPSDVQLSTSLSAFQQRLKTFLFHKSLPDVLL